MIFVLIFKRSFRHRFASYLVHRWICLIWTKLFLRNVVVWLKPRTNVCTGFVFNLINKLQFAYELDIFPSLNSLFISKFKHSVLFAIKVKKKIWNTMFVNVEISSECRTNYQQNLKMLNTSSNISLRKLSSSKSSTRYLTAEIKTVHSDQYPKKGGKGFSNFRSNLYNLTL